MHSAIRGLFGYLNHWKQALMGPVVTIILLIYQQATAKPPTWGWFIAIVAMGLAWQFFTEWQKEKQRALPDRVPELYLQYDSAHSRSIQYSGFFLRTEGERKAANVEISCDDTVGDGHVILGLTWKSAGKPIGADLVPLELSCTYKKDGRCSGYSGYGGEQINHFFNNKKESPLEVIVTVTYTDVAGHVCPPRKFRIWREEDVVSKVLGVGKVHCEPVKNQAAS